MSEAVGVPQCDTQGNWFHVDDDRGQHWKYEKQGVSKEDVKHLEWQLGNLPILLNENGGALVVNGGHAALRAAR